MLSMNEILDLYRERLANTAWVRAKRLQMKNGHGDPTDPAFVALGLIDHRDYATASRDKDQRTVAKEKKA